MACLAELEWGAGEMAQLLLFQRTWVWLPVPTGQLTTTCSSQHPLLASSGIRHTRGAQVCMRQNNQKQSEIQNKNKKQDLTRQGPLVLHQQLSVKSRTVAFGKDPDFWSLHHPTPHLLHSFKSLSWPEGGGDIEKNGKRTMSKTATFYVWAVRSLGKDMRSESNRSPSYLETSEGCSTGYSSWKEPLLRTHCCLFFFFFSFLFGADVSYCLSRR